MEHKRRSKVLYAIVGALSLLIGVIFLFLPVLPTVPFLVLSAFCFSKVSDKIHAKILRLPYIGKWMREKSGHRNAPR